jgi:uncharacterized protein GlcG (DUF336 family)
MEVALLASPNITLEQAQAVITAALAKADEIGQAMNVAVVDAGNNLTAFSRQDGAWLGSTDIALNKAFTARAFDLATADLHDNVQPGAPLYGIGHSNQGRVISFGGGLPLIRDGEVVGAVGVSGGSVEQDVGVAEAGVGGFHG